LAIKTLQLDGEKAEEVS